MSGLDKSPELEVEPRAEFDSGPAAFTWQGTRWVVNSVGRTWEADGEQHFLVMVQGDRVFELAYSEVSGSWRMVRQPEDFRPGRKAT